MLALMRRQEIPFYDRLIDGLFQDEDCCALCGQTGDFPARLCPDCHDRFVSIPSWRQLPLSGGGEALCYSGYLYNNFLKDHFRAYKFEGASYLEEVFVRLLVESYDQLPLQDRSWITYMPSYPRREIERGYNPAQCLAASLAQERDLLLVHVLEKYKNTREQNKLSARERTINIEGSLRLAAEAGKVRASRWRADWGRWEELALPLEEVQDQAGLLFDDFLTSGATMTCGLSLMAAAGFQATGLTLGVASMPEEGFLLKAGTEEIQ